MNSQAELIEKPLAEIIQDHFRKADIVVEELKEKYSGLTVATHGLKTVKAARIDMKNKRCAVERLRKELKADALERGRLIDGEAKRLTELLTPIEEALEKEENAEEERKAAEARAKVEAEERRLQERCSQLVAVGVVPDLITVRGMSDSQFADYLTEQTIAAELAAQKAREEREAAEKREAEERAERERLEAERQAELARQHEELRIRQEELQAESERQLALIKAERERIQAEQAERDRIEEERRQAEQEALEIERAKLREQREELQRIEAERQAEADRLALIEAERIRNEEEAATALAEQERQQRLKPAIEQAEAWAKKMEYESSVFIQGIGSPAWGAYAQDLMNQMFDAVASHIERAC